VGWADKEYWEMGRVDTLFYLPSYWVLGVDYDPLEGQRIGLELKGVGRAHWPYYCVGAK